MTNITIPGPGSAMAFAVSVAIYSSAFASEISDLFRVILIIMAVFFSGVTYQIEKLHKNEKTNKDISTTVQDENEHNGELKITKEQYVLSISILLMSIGIGFWGNLLANYYFSLFRTDLYIFIIVLILFFGFIAVLIYLAYDKLYPKN